jgi:2-C-methyl-D-erythritol 4-phosphate cytidylyltransferase/2-C-methyl-D-erythritol 2,4-cyclodiphosphate synthase
MHVTAIIAAGGTGRRLGADLPKQLLEIGGRSILQRSVEAFLAHPRVTDVIVAVPPAIAGSPPEWMRAARVVAGGDTRQASVANAFDAVTAQAHIVVVHDAARPFVTADVISRAIDGAAEHGAAIAAVPVNDTVKRVGDSGPAPVIVETLPRECIYMAQTPQAFRRPVLEKAVALGRSGVEATDEAALAERAGHKVRIVAGDASNVKITTSTDLDTARERDRRHASAASAGRVGIGYDLHRLVEGRPLILGGITVPSDRGAHGHSDADVVCHAVTDAILGAARAGDIGQHFPDTDPRWEGASGTALLRDAVRIVRRQGWTVENVDVVIVLERPKLGPHRAAMESQLAEAIGIPREAVSVKAKTNEGVDAVGRGEAVAAHAIALLRTER